MWILTHHLQRKGNRQRKRQLRQAKLDSRRQRKAYKRSRRA